MLQLIVMQRCERMDAGMATACPVVGNSQAFNLIRVDGWTAYLLILAVSGCTLLALAVLGSNFLWVSTSVHTHCKIHITTALAILPYSMHTASF
jgi:hypothetical protein